MNEQYNEQASISLNRFFVMFMHGLKKLWFLVLALTIVVGAHVTQSGGNRRIHLRERISDILSVRITEEIQS